MKVLMVGVKRSRPLRMQGDCSAVGCTGQVRVSALPGVSTRGGGSNPKVAEHYPGI